MDTQVHSVIGAVTLRAEQAPESIAYLDSMGSITYGDLHLAALRGAGWLASLGVRAGDTVALALEVSPAGGRRALELLYALGWIGAVALPLLPDTPTPARVAMIERFRANWLLAHGAPAQVANAHSLDPLLFDPRDPSLEQRAPPRGDGENIGFVYSFTSGTTGSSKALLSTHGQIVEKSRFAAQAIGMDASDRLLPIAPWPTGVGMRYLLRAHAVGAAFVSTWIAETREELGETLQRFGVTRMYVTPWQLRSLARSAAPEPPLPPLRSLSIIGAMVSREEIGTGRAILSPNLLIDYGCNEVGPLALLRAADVTGNPAGCVGRLLEGVEVRVEDASGQALASGETGELGFRAPWMSTEYAGDPESTRACFRDGWFYPGDAGRIDAERRVYLAGRTREVINCGGMKIWPEEIEAVIRQQPMVADAAVAGLPHPLAGQVAAAFVVLRPSVVLQVGPRELYEFCLARLEKAQVPPHFFIVAKIPRNQAGKIMRDELVASYAGAAEVARGS